MIDNDDTAQGPAETEVFAVGETQGLAWSQADIDNVVPYVRSQPRWPWAVLATGVVVVAVAAYLVGQQQNQSNTVQSTVKAFAPSVPAVAPPAVAAPPVIVPAPVSPSATTPPSFEDRDALYFNLLQTADVHFATQSAAIYNGHLVCEALDRGDSIQAVIAANTAKSPLVASEQVARGVRAAIVAYCPQYAE